MTTRVGWYSVLVNIILFGLNLLMAAYSGSLALRAETAHNLLDLAASLSVLGGLALSQRKSRDFPYGLYKLENMVAVFIAFGMFFTGYEIAKEALFASAAPPNVRPIMLAGVALAMAIPIGFSQYELRIGREINSPSIIADATEFRAHILSSGVVFIAIAAQLLGFPLDRVAAVLIVLWIAYMGWRTLVDGMRVLLDASLDAPTLEAIRTIITSNPEVSEIKSLMGRNSGRYRFVESEIMLRVQDLDRAHQVATQLEESIRAEIPHVERVLIHTEPMRKQILRVAVPLASRDGEIAMDFGRASYFALVKISAKDGVVLEQNILSAPKLLETKGRGLRTAEWLVSQQIDVLMTREDLTGKAPAYALKAAGVQVQTIDLHTLTEVISQNETLKGIADAGT
jgi:cation diffusion facilitator family transporter